MELTPSVSDSSSPTATSTVPWLPEDPTPPQELPPLPLLPLSELQAVAKTSDKVASMANTYNCAFFIPFSFL
jgi:hypothetical protein